MYLYNLNIDLFIWKITIILLYYYKKNDFEVWFVFFE